MNPFLAIFKANCSLNCRVPPNVKFEIDDVESEWVGVKKYDFIMCRYMAASIQDWPKLIANIYEYVYLYYLSSNRSYYSHLTPASPATSTQEAGPSSKT